VLVTSGIFLGILILLNTRSEIAYWHLAAAREHWREADYGAIQGHLSATEEHRKQAFDLLEQAFRWSPEDSYLLRQRAQWKLEAKQYDAALVDVNGLLQADSDDVPTLELRTKIYHLMGKHSAAVADARRVNDISQTSGYPSRTQALNSLAYAKAIGKIELDSALREVNESLVSGRNAAILDTRGFIYYQMGKYDLALRDIDPAANEIAAALAALHRDSGLERRAMPDLRKFEVAVQQRNEDVAPIFYHRALVHEKLGHTAAAEADRKRVKELIGRDGDESLF